MIAFFCLFAEKHRRNEPGEEEKGKKKRMEKGGSSIRFCRQSCYRSMLPVALSLMT